jgi:hypothetical protein
MHMCIEMEAVCKGAMWWCMKSMVHYNGGMVYRQVVYGWGCIDVDLWSEG